MVVVWDAARRQWERRMSVKISVKVAVIAVGLTLFIVDLILIKRLSNAQNLLEKSIRFENSNNNSKRAQPPEFPSVNSEIRPIIILSTFRSGSTLTGEILQQAEDSFYLYEPLNPLNYRMYGVLNTTRLQLVNGSSRSVGAYDFNKMSIDILASLITCDFWSLDIDTASHGFLFYSRRSIPYITCVNLNKRKTTLLNAVRKCMHIWKENCENSTFRIFKVVRLSMDWMEILLKKFPRLMVVHLVRDPRAIQISRDKLGANIFKNLRHGFTELCNLLAWNLSFETKLNQTYGRIFRLFYETLAVHPFKTSKWLYNVLGLSYTSDVNTHVHHLTRAGVADDCPTCAVRANSSAHVHSWKKIFNKTHIDDIIEVCGSYMKDLGYT